MAANETQSARKSNPDAARTIPRTAAAALWLGTFAVAWIVVGIGCVQLGLIQPIAAFMLFAIGLGTALLAVLFGALGLLFSGGARAGGRRVAAIGLVVGVGLVALTVAGARDGLGKPPINDISTDLENPPSFASADVVPDYENRDMSYPEEFVPVVKQGYPALSPVRLPLAPDEAYRRSLEIAEKLGWQITHRDPVAGTFDAKETTALFRFVDDITVRVRGEDGEAVVDVRSKSRDGRGDMGANAARIERFAERFQELPNVATR